ncbi:MAG: nucleoside transporter C-terminal domain-containing protein [Bacteroidota bacterium]
MHSIRKGSLLIICWLGIYASVSATVTKDSLQNMWAISSGVGSLLTEEHSSDPHFLRFSIDSFYVSTQAGILVSGKYLLEGDSLLFQFERLSVEATIDSVVYSVENDQPVFDFFYKGEKLASQSMTDIQSERRVIICQVERQADEGYIFSHAGGIISIEERSYTKPSPFSFLDILRGILGTVAMVFAGWLFSENRKKINWRLVGSGLVLQLVFALLVLKVPFVKDGFSAIAGAFVEILNFTTAGSAFLFEGLVADVNKFGYIFAFQILPTIVFFSAFMSLLYYLGVLQKIVYGFAWLMKRTMKLSGAESLAAAGNIFVGQTEAPLLVRPYLEKMTRSEIMSLMTGGMATIAGGVFAAYIGYLGGTDPVQQQLFATHLLSASIMSAPAALVAAKLIVPETKEVLQDLSVPKEKIGSNVLDAITNGSRDGLRLAVNVGIMIMVFIAFMAMINYLLASQIGNIHIGSSPSLNETIAAATDGKYQFNLQYLLGMLFAPIAWIIGVPTEDMVVIGQLLGEKTVLNEFVAYVSLADLKDAGAIVHYKSILIATYALCGFANFSSIGIQIGGIGALAPSQRVTLAQLGVKSLIGGTIAAFMTASLAGMLFSI